MWIYSSFVHGLGENKFKENLVQLFCYMVLKEATFS